MAVAVEAGGGRGAAHYQDARAGVVAVEVVGGSGYRSQNQLCITVVANGLVIE